MVASESRNVRRARTVARLVGAVAGMVGGILYGTFIVQQMGGALATGTAAGLVVVLGTGVAGAAALALAAPLLSVDPFLWVEHVLDTAPPGELLGALAGLGAGLLISALVAVLLNPLPWGLGMMIGLALACPLVYIGVRTGRRRREAFADALRGAGPRRLEVDERAPQDGSPIVVDTSVLIDGRILDVAATGFIQGRLLVPAFVLEEVQRVADSGDPLRRSRGRRGLAVVEDLKRQTQVACEVIDLDFPGTPEVDSRLLRVARARGAALMTNDWNLNRLATAEGIRVLNLNDLANAVKPIVGSGESLELTIVREGREPHQGVGYLEDGTMVVVEGGREHLDRQVQVMVTSVLQTQAGRMIFASAAGDGRRQAEPGPPGESRRAGVPAPVSGGPEVLPARRRPGAARPTRAGGR
jgi:uncharacterized protein YacL